MVTFNKQRKRNKSIRIKIIEINCLSHTRVIEIQTDKLTATSYTRAHTGVTEYRTVIIHPKREKGFRKIRLVVCQAWGGHTYKSETTISTTSVFHRETKRRCGLTRISRTNGGSFDDAILHISTNATHNGPMFTLS